MNIVLEPGAAALLDELHLSLIHIFGLLLTNMELQSLKLIIRHSIFPLYLYSKYYFYS